MDNSNEMKNRSAQDAKRLIGIVGQSSLAWEIRKYGKNYSFVTHSAGHDASIDITIGGGYQVFVDDRAIRSKLSDFNGRNYFTNPEPALAEAERLLMLRVKNEKLNRKRREAREERKWAAKRPIW